MQTRYIEEAPDACIVSDDARGNSLPAETHTGNACGRYRETDAYARGIARARAVMAGEADPFAHQPAAAPSPVAELVDVVRAKTHTERRYRKIRPRTFAALDWRTGELFDDDGGALLLDERCSVAQLLDQLPGYVERVYLTGPRPFADDADGFRAWHTEHVPGWTARHYLERSTRPILEWRTDDGRVVELLRAATWLGETDAPPHEVVRAMVRLGAALRERFGDDATVLRSPATTGRELFVRSIARGDQHAVLPDDVQAQIRATSTQGRIELLWQGGELPGLVEYDARVQYAALCTELPSGEPERWRGEHPYGDFARCRVLARWTIPAAWDHVGILPVLETGHGWTWPAEPGTTHEGWIAGVELHLARRWGWDVQVLESLVWPTKGRPLDTWARKIADAAMDAEHNGDQLVRSALRAVVLHAIGAFQGREHVVTKAAGVDEVTDLPAGATGLRWEGDAIVWGELAGQAWPELAHPEWCAEVWARARCRLLDSPAPGGRVGALHVPRAQLVGLYTDAIYLTTDPGWPDDGKVGRFRREMAHVGPVRAPRSIGDLPIVRDEVLAR